MPTPVAILATIVLMMGSGPAKKNNKDYNNLNNKYEQQLDRMDARIHAMNEEMRTKEVVNEISIDVKKDSAKRDLKIAAYNALVEKRMQEPEYKIDRVNKFCYTTDSLDSVRNIEYSTLAKVGKLYFFCIGETE